MRDRAPIDFERNKTTKRVRDLERRKNANKFELFRLFAIAMWGHQKRSELITHIKIHSGVVVVHNITFNISFKINGKKRERERERIKQTAQITD